MSGIKAVAFLASAGSGIAIAVSLLVIGNLFMEVNDMYREVLADMDEFKENALLYDKRNPFYSCDKQREKTWIEIAQKLSEEFPEEELTTKTVKTRWSSLRTVYSKKKKPSTGSSSQKTNWVFFDSMRFLDSFIDDRKTVSSMDAPDRFEVDDGYESDKGIGVSSADIWIDREESPSQPVQKRKRKKNEVDPTSQAIMNLVEASNKQLDDLEHRRNYHFGMEVAQILDALAEDVQIEKKKRISCILFAQKMDREARALVARRDALLLLMIRQRRAVRKPKDIHRRRNYFGQYSRLFNELRSDEKSFKEYTRMAPRTFHKLLRLVQPFLEPKKKKTTGICAEHMLVVTLRYLTTGNSFHSLHFAFRMGVSTVSKVVKKTCEALYKALKNNISFPETPDGWLELSNAFEQQWNFPHVLGAIDGKHIQIQKPCRSGSLFFNYKHFFSTVLLGVCDADYKFLYYDIGNYGHHHDSHVLESSSFGRKLQEGSFVFPEDSHLRGTGTLLSYFFLGDAGFPLQTRIMKPFAGITSKAQATFDYRLSRARRVIEDAFGILATRWRILLKDIETSTPLADSIVRACLHLHNFLSDEEPFTRRRHNETGVDPELFVQARMESAPVHPLRSQNPTTYAKMVRRKLVDYFRREGRVRWQDQASACSFQIVVKTRRVRVLFKLLSYHCC
ncbi:hypothetical protein QR680_015512 [Steinernema hermaphroditum]|uniref:MADF domain-containing protein n=1 Tax=Steinernema hermaphroditum TaxID=289476 RepID=A0AA39LKC5_9BILA|nr:hypothetical protein QR680_015512 [Steinernema hermaphroditum]